MPASVVVPEAFPRVIVVAAPPIFNIVALVLKIVAVPAVVVKSPPLRAISPVFVRLPVLVISVPSLLKLVDSVHADQFHRSVELFTVPASTLDFVTQDGAPHVVAESN